MSMTKEDFVEKDLVKGDFVGELLQKHGFKYEALKIEDFSAYSTSKDDIVGILKLLQSDKNMRFTILTDLFAADFPDRPKRFEIVYSLLSLMLNKRVLLKIAADEGEDVPSSAQVFSAACWYEREAFDMFGIKFTDCPDQRRILTDYGFVGHPLRKDFPVTGHVQVKYDEALEEVIYEPVCLDQEFRNFDFMSPWRGPKEYILPGDEKATKT